MEMLTGVNMISRGLVFFLFFSYANNKCTYLDSIRERYRSRKSSTFIRNLILIGFVRTLDDLHSMKHTVSSSEK